MNGTAFIPDYLTSCFSQLVLNLMNDLYTGPDQPSSEIGYVFLFDRGKFLSSPSMVYGYQAMQRPILVRFLTNLPWLIHL